MIIINQKKQIVVKKHEGLTVETKTNSKLRAMKPLKQQFSELSIQVSKKIVKKQKKTQEKIAQAVMILLTLILILIPTLIPIRILIVTKNIFN